MSRIALFEPFPAFRSLTRGPPSAWELAAGPRRLRRRRVPRDLPVYLGAIGAVYQGLFSLEGSHLGLFAGRTTRPIKAVEPSQAAGDGVHATSALQDYGRDSPTTRQTDSPAVSLTRPRRRSVAGDCRMGSPWSGMYLELCRLSQA
jgi:hypothetical protein